MATATNQAILAAAEAISQIPVADIKKALEDCESAVALVKEMPPLSRTMVLRELARMPDFQDLLNEVRKGAAPVTSLTTKVEVDDEAPAAKKLVAPKAAAGKKLTLEQDIVAGKVARIMRHGKGKITEFMLGTDIRLAVLQRKGKQSVGFDVSTLRLIPIPDTGCQQDMRNVSANQAKEYMHALWRVFTVMQQCDGNWDAKHLDLLNAKAMQIVCTLCNIPKSTHLTKEARKNAILAALREHYAKA